MSRTELPLRQWLALGQAMLEQTPEIHRPYGRGKFEADDTQILRLGKGVTVKAARKTFGPGEYVRAIR